MRCKSCSIVDQKLVKTYTPHRSRLIRPLSLTIRNFSSSFSVGSSHAKCQSFTLRFLHISMISSFICRTSMPPSNVTHAFESINCCSKSLRSDAARRFWSSKYISSCPFQNSDRSATFRVRHPSLSGVMQTHLLIARDLISGNLSSVHQVLL